MSLVPAPRNLIATSFLLLALAAFFGLLNNFKIKGWHDAMSSATRQQKAAEVRLIVPGKESQGARSVPSRGQPEDPRS